MSRDLCVFIHDGAVTGPIPIVNGDSSLVLLATVMLPPAAGLDRRWLTRRLGQQGDGYPARRRAVCGEGLVTTKERFVRKTPCP